MKQPLLCFKAARLFSPHKIQPSTSDVDCFSFSVWQTRLPIGETTSLYIAASEDIGHDCKTLEFWKYQRHYHLN